MNSVRVSRIFRVISEIFHDFCDFGAISDKIPFELRVISVFFRDFREFRVNSEFRVNLVRFPCNFYDFPVFRAIFDRIPCKFCVFPWFS